MSNTILLAIGNEAITNHLRTYLSSYGFEILPNVIQHRMYLNEAIELSMPNIVIVQDITLGSNYESQDEKDEEMLQMIEDWRSQYDTDLRVVYLCVRAKNDPFLSKLVARNVLDIFNEATVATGTIIKQLLEPPRFNNVKKFGTGTFSMSKYNEEPQQAPQAVVTEPPATTDAAVSQPVPVKMEPSPNDLLATTIEESIAVAVDVVKKEKGSLSRAFSGIKDGAAAIKVKIPKRGQLEIDQSEEMQESLYAVDVNLMDDLMSLLPSNDEMPVNATPTVIGTVLIAVAGVKPHIGATHTSLNIARYIAKLGNSVAVIEANYSQDFDRIHALYEGERKLLKQDNSFEMEGIQHFKYRNDLDLNHLYSAYEYVIMDYGDLEEAAFYTEEFKRAHLRVVICSGDEWKLHWITDFLKRHKLEKTDCTFLIPSAGADKAKDLQERLNYSDVHAITNQDNPYEPERSTEQLLHRLLVDFLKVPNGGMFSKNAVILTAVLSVVLTAIIVMVFTQL